MKLYELTNALLWCADSDELAPDLESQLDALEGQLAEKAEGICKMVRNLEAEEKALKEEAERFAKRAQTAANGKDRLKTYLKTNLDALGITKLDAGLFKLRTQPNSVASVTVDCEPASLPVEYQAVKIEANKKALVDAWKARLPMPEGVRVEKGSHLRIS